MLALLKFQDILQSKVTVLIIGVIADASVVIGYSLANEKKSDTHLPYM